MTATETRTVTVERDFPCPPAKLWRALTQPHLIAEWLMKNDFLPEMGHRFELQADWGTVAGEVLELEPETMLAYRWDASGLESVVTWTLTPTAAGTRLRMEQTGFKSEQKLAYHGARAGWPKFFTALEQVVAQID